MVRSRLSRPLPLLLLVTGLFTFLVQSGELGTSDTTHRLQVTHSLWTGEPQVFPREYPEFGVHGRGGALYASYGIGQSLLMLPADLAGSAASHLPIWHGYVEREVDPSIRNIVVSFSTNILVNVLTALAAFRFLALFGFSVAESVVGTLGLLLATTHLHYAQNMMENNYLLLLTLTGLTLQYRWLQTGDQQALFWGSAALGLNLLTRLTAVLDIGGAACFLLLAGVFARRAPTSARTLAVPGFSAIRTYLRTAVPVYAVFLFLDRLYQYVRFGSWTNTYLALYAREQRLADPALPANFPFNGTLFQGGVHSGILGPLFSPDKSILLFDPMFPLALLLGAVLWRRLEGEQRAFIAATLLLLCGYLFFYGRYLWWAGDFSWGDRYVSSVVELASLLALPLLLRYRRDLGQKLFVLGLAISAASVTIQCASLAFWLPLEIYQTQDFGRSLPIIPLRFKNIAAFALHKRAAWGLNTPSMFEDTWEVPHLTAWYFLPSLLRHIGAAPLWAVHVLYGIWAMAAVCLAWCSAKLLRAACEPAFTGENRP